jgi:D,D-heptose 1,7-bisphosphate phosphatase
MRAVILVGGKGTRLGSVTSQLPKPLVPVNGKALLDRQLDQLHRYGITDVTLLASHLADQIEAHVAARMERVRVHRELAPLGTAGGLHEITDELTDPFLLVYGDVLFDLDLSRLLAAHRASAGLATLVVHPNDHPHDSDLVEIDAEHRVTAVHAKPHAPGQYFHNLVNAGMYVLSPRILDVVPRGKATDFGRDIFPAIFETERIFGYPTPEYIKDMGTPDRLAKVSADDASGKVARWNLEHSRPAVFLDRDGVINAADGYIDTPEKLHLLPGVSDAIQKLNRSDYLSVVVTNQPAVARNLTTLDGLDAIHRKLETVLGESRAWLDAIFFCPHHPDGGFAGENVALKIDCACRKPKAGMIESARARFNIDMARSYIVGDSARDIVCGKTAGITTIGVRSGEACRDVTLSSRPDFMFEDLPEAVEFILHPPWRDEVAAIADQVLSSRAERGPRTPGAPATRVISPFVVRPFVISIAGNSRGGKSTFAELLRRELAARGKRAVRISLDDWLMPRAERTPGMGVLDRFRITQIERDVAALLGGEVVSVYPYDALSGTRRDDAIEHSGAEAEVVILDGVVALGTDSLRSMADMRVFIDVSLDTWRARGAAFLAWKGHGPDEVASILDLRTIDEFGVIAAHARWASTVVTQPR